MRKKLKLLIIIMALIIFLPIGANIASQIIGAGHYDITGIANNNENSKKAVQRVEDYLRKTYGNELIVWDDTTPGNSPNRVFRHPYRSEIRSKITDRAIRRLLNEDPSQGLGKGNNSDEEKQSPLGWMVIIGLLVVYVIVSRRLGDDIYRIFTAWYSTLRKFYVATSLYFHFIEILL